MGSGDTCNVEVIFLAGDRTAVDEAFDAEPDEVHNLQNGAVLLYVIDDYRYPDMEIRDLAKRGLTFYGHFSNTWESPGGHFVCLDGDLVLVDTPYGEFKVGVDADGQILKEDHDLVLAYCDVERKVKERIGPIEGP